MWALRTDIASWTIQTNNNILHVTNITCIFVIIRSISVSNSVSISVESLIENCGGSIFMYSWLALINEFTSSTKNNHESLNFFYWNWKPMHSQNYIPTNKQNSQPMKISPHEIKWFYSIIFTRCDIFLLMVYSLFLFRLSFLKLFSHINHLCI